MAGTPDNDDPRSFNRADPADATAKLVRLMREVKPDVVITHDSTGGYGHPDHIMSSRYVTAAFDAGGDSRQFVDAGAAWQPSRLLYAAAPRSFFLNMRDQMRAMNIDTTMFDDLDSDSTGYDDDEITTIVDVSSQGERKLAAFRAHRTQFGPESPFVRLPETVLLELFTREYFIQARPDPNRNTPIRPELADTAFT